MTTKKAAAAQPAKKHFYVSILQMGSWEQYGSSCDSFEAATDLRYKAERAGYTAKVSVVPYFETVRK